MRICEEQTWEEYEADPRNHLYFAGSVRILSDSRLSNEAKLMSCYMSLRSFDTNEIDSIADFFNGSMTPTQIVNAVLELLDKGYVFESTDHSLYLPESCYRLSWENQNVSE